jgi:surface protein
MIISLNKFKATGGTKVEGNFDITENGVYDVSSFATITINTDASQGVDYSYLTGGVDVEGLKAIGWNDESIRYFRDNLNIYSWQAPEFMVSEENKALCDILKDYYSIQSFKDNPNLIYCPMTENLYIKSEAFSYLKKLIAIPLFDTKDCKNLYRLFFHCESLKSIPPLNTSNVTDMHSIFEDCHSLQNIPMLDTSNVTNMSYMFYACKSLLSIPLLDTSNVTNMESMFSNCESLKSIPPLNTSNTTNMSSMFNWCDALTTIPPIDTSNVTNMQNMFANCKSLKSIPPLNTSNVTRIIGMFSNCEALTTIPPIDTSNATDMSSMFYYCKSLKSIPTLNTSNATDMYHMFNYCSELTTIPPLDTAKVTRMDSMFASCNKLTTIEGIDFSSITSGQNLFGYSTWNSLTHIIVNGKIDFSWTSYGSVQYMPNIDYDSIKSILTAMSNTSNTKAKTLAFNHTLTDKGTELRDLVSLCTSKGWTITGLLINNDPDSESSIALPISVIDANTNEKVGEFKQTVTSVSNVYSYPFENVTGDFYFVDAQGNYYANPVSTADKIYGKNSSTANVSTAASYYLNKSQQVIHVDTTTRYVVHICLDDETIRWNGNTASIPTGTPTK